MFVVDTLFMLIFGADVVTRWYVMGTRKFFEDLLCLADLSVSMFDVSPACWWVARQAGACDCARTVLRRFLGVATYHSWALAPTHPCPDCRFWALRSRSRSLLRARPPYRTRRRCRKPHSTLPHCACSEACVESRYATRTRTYLWT